MFKSVNWSMKCLYVIMESIDIFNEKQANTDNLKL